MYFLMENMIVRNCLMICHQNGPNLQSTQGTINETGILDPIEFCWVPQMPEMVMQKSSHDRCCFAQVTAAGGGGGGRFAPVTGVSVFRSQLKNALLGVAS